MAIIGISGRYPGAADPDALWRNLSAGRSTIGTLSREALLNGGDATDDSPQWAVGALAGKHLFDPLLFRITPAEARTLDPQERLFLQAVWHCLEDSGHTAAACGGRPGGSACLSVRCGATTSISRPRSTADGPPRFSRRLPTGCPSSTISMAPAWWSIPRVRRR
ncbi:beta-ketoacyl synthase N-terminal-like domain-containing protein [Ralstonia solanacearum]